METVLISESFCERKQIRDCNNVFTEREHLECVIDATALM